MHAADPAPAEEHARATRAHGAQGTVRVRLSGGARGRGPRASQPSRSCAHARPAACPGANARCLWGPDGGGLAFACAPFAAAFERGTV
uniref:Uncharacterized protein n=1 Tax=Oryza sativa subsp. japonica TaxID=39947 RepID=Q67J24_ORYSJ|nr:hypothetical protein [Oryza sativa Japonica Group]BAD38517.1 hypothetical protein [Oryza sativa Japonica Group]